LGGHIGPPLLFGKDPRHKTEDRRGTMEDGRQRFMICDLRLRFKIASAYKTGLAMTFLIDFSTSPAAALEMTQRMSNIEYRTRNNE